MKTNADWPQKRPIVVRRGLRQWRYSEGSNSGGLRSVRLAWTNVRTRTWFTPAILTLLGKLARKQVDYRTSQTPRHVSPLDRRRCPRMLQMGQIAFLPAEGDRWVGPARVRGCAADCHRGDFRFGARRRSQTSSTGLTRIRSAVKQTCTVQVGASNGLC